MKHLLLFIILGFLAAPLAAQNAGSKIKSIGLSDLQELMVEPSSVVHVVNFWATWCKPCIEELPAFEQLSQNYKDRGVTVYLVSLDMADRYQSGKVDAFIEKKGFSSAKIVWMSDVNFNEWLPKVDSDWSGAIPATLFVGNGARRFEEKTFTYEELEALIGDFLPGSK